MGASKGLEIYAPKSVPAILFRQPPDTSRLKISPGSHVTVTSNGRQHTSQSVVNRCPGTLVSMTTSDVCPQNGQEMDSQTSTPEI